MAHVCCMWLRASCSTEESLVLLYSAARLSFRHHDGDTGTWQHPHQLWSHGGSLDPDVGGSLPRFSRVWLSHQTLFGRDLSVGVEFQCMQAVGQAVYLGVHFARSRSDNVVIDAGVTVLFAPFSGQCQMLFEDENEVLQATALPQVSQCTQRVEAWLSIIQSGALHFVRQCGVSSVLVPLSLRGHHSKHEHHRVS